MLTIGFWNINKNIFDINYFNNFNQIPEILILAEVNKEDLKYRSSVTIKNIEYIVFQRDVSKGGDILAFLIKKDLIYKAKHLYYDRGHHVRVIEFNNKIIEGIHFPSPIPDYSFLEKRVNSFKDTRNTTIFIGDFNLDISKYANKIDSKLAIKFIEIMKNNNCELLKDNNVINTCANKYLDYAFINKNYINNATIKYYDFDYFLSDHKYFEININI